MSSLELEGRAAVAVVEARVRRIVLHARLPGSGETDAVQIHVVLLLGGVALNVEDESPPCLEILTTQAVRRATSSSSPRASWLDPPRSPGAWHAGEPAHGPGTGHACCLLRRHFSCPVGIGPHRLHLCQLARIECLKLCQPNRSHLGGFPVKRPALRDPPAFSEDGLLLPQLPGGFGMARGGNGEKGADQGNHHAGPAGGHRTIFPLAHAGPRCPESTELQSSRLSRPMQTGYEGCAD